MRVEETFVRHKQRTRTEPPQKALPKLREVSSWTVPRKRPVIEQVWDGGTVRLELRHEARLARYRVVHPPAQASPAQGQRERARRLAQAAQGRISLWAPGVSPTPKATAFQSLWGRLTGKAA